MKVYIIIGTYLCESGYKMPRVHANKEMAMKDLEMIKSVNNDMQWEMVEMELMGNNIPTIK